MTIRPSYALHALVLLLGACASQPLGPSADLDALTADLAAQYTRNRHGEESEQRRVALVCLNAQNVHGNRMCHEAAERLTRAIFLQGAEVVEPATLGAAVQEQVRQSGAEFDERAAVKAGHFVGATQIGVGRYSETGGLGTLAFKFIGVEKALLESVAEGSMSLPTVRRLFPANRDGDTLRVTGLDVEIQPTKASGAPWDVAGVNEAPDIEVVMTIGKNQPIVFGKQQDNPHPVWRTGGSNAWLFVYDSRDP